MMHFDHFINYVKFSPYKLVQIFPSSQTLITPAPYPRIHLLAKTSKFGFPNSTTHVPNFTISVSQGDAICLLLFESKIRKVFHRISD